jgi:DNA-binding response OmpR family regulator
MGLPALRRASAGAGAEPRSASGYHPRGEADPSDRAVDNQISPLRRKIESDARTPPLIGTVWGGGHALSAEVVRG